VYNQYIVRVDAERRDALRAYLSERQVGTEIYYPIPLHLQVCFQTLNYGEGDFPESERAAKQTLALPIYPELTEDAQRTVVDAIATFFGRKAIGHGIPKPHVATTGVRSSAKV
jgi:dTDP-4-amino-4,6-dideoxygalactose transaminase